MDMLHGMTYIGYLGFLAAICYLIWKQRQNKAYGKQQENNLNEEEQQILNLISK